MQDIDVKALIGAALEQKVVNNHAFDPIYKKKVLQNKKFACPKTIKQDALLFIGLNPSDSNNTPASEDVDYYPLENKDNPHPYFKKFEDIAQYCNVEWTHIDLLFIKETDQHKILGSLFSKDGENKDKKKNKIGVGFIWEQLQLSKILIEKSNPKAIVVCNTLSRTFLGADKKNGKNIWLDFEFHFDEELGTYRWKNIPVFFSSMLTGQRALDRGSYERLRWHIKKVLQDIKN